MPDDRELVAVQPGEYILTWDAVRKMGGKHGVDKIVEKLDSNSNAALDGKVLNPISKDFGIKPYNTSLNLSSMMSKNMPKGSMMPGSSGSGGNTEIPQEFHSPICPFSSGHRETIFQVLGIIA
jgi:hypothetical protein